MLLKEVRRAVAEQEKHPCTVRRQPDVLRPGLWASGRPARREARVPAGQLKDAAPSGARSAGQSATLESPAHLQRAARAALAPAIVTVRPRRQRRLGGASPRSRVCGIERGAGLPAGARPENSGELTLHI